MLSLKSILRSLLFFSMSFSSLFSEEPLVIAVAVLRGFCIYWQSTYIVKGSKRSRETNLRRAGMEVHRTYYSTYNNDTHILTLSIRDVCGGRFMRGSNSICALYGLPYSGNLISFCISHSKACINSHKYRHRPIAEVPPQRLQPVSLQLEAKYKIVTIPYLCQ